MINISRQYIEDSLKDKLVIKEIRHIYKHLDYKRDLSLSEMDNLIECCRFNLEKSEGIETISLISGISSDTVSIPFIFRRVFINDDPVSNKSYQINPRYEMNIDLRDHQIEILEEARNVLDVNKSILLELYTGFGKTIVACQLCCDFLNSCDYRSSSENIDDISENIDDISENIDDRSNIPVSSDNIDDRSNIPVSSENIDDRSNNILIIVNSIMIKDQWINTFRKMSNLGLTDINLNTIDDILDDSHEVSQEVNLDRESNKIRCRVFIVMKTYLVNHRQILDKIKPVYLIVDEVDTFCTSVGIKSIISVYPEYIILMTATEQRSDDNNRFLKFLYFDKIKRIFSGNLRVMKVKTQFRPDIVNSRGRPDWVKLIDSLCNNDSRTRFIIRLAKSLLDNGRKVLILTKRISHVESLSSVAREMNIDHSIFQGSDKTYEDSMMIIGTDKKLNRGFDEKSICQQFNNIRIDCLILTYTIMNQYTLIQTIGRIARSDNPILVQIIDDNGILERHWNLNVKIYNKSNTEIISLSRQKQVDNKPEIDKSGTISVFRRDVNKCTELSRLFGDSRE